MSAAEPTAYRFAESLKPRTRYHLFKYLSVDRWINRPLASLVVRAVFRTRLTPNQLTWIAFFFSMAGAAAFVAATPAWVLAAAVLAFIGTVLDGADGMLARARNMCSGYGAHLDLILDRVVDTFTFAAVTVAYFRQSGKLAWLVAGLFGVSLYLLQVNLYYLMNSYRHNPYTGESSEARALTYFGLLVFAALNRLDVLVAVTVVEPAIVVASKLFRFVRWGRRPPPAP